MTTSDWIQTIASVVTAVGVAIAAWQLYHTKQQSQSQFEDSFAEQAAAFAAKLPLEALLGRELGDEEVKAHLRVFYEYFDLSNEQAFIARQGRLRPETWANWREGIEQHMSRRGFKQAWTTLRPGWQFRRFQGPSSTIVAQGEHSGNDRRQRSAAPTGSRRTGLAEVLGRRRLKSFEACRASPVSLSACSLRRPASWP